MQQLFRINLEWMIGFNANSWTMGIVRFGSIEIAFVQRIFATILEAFMENNFGKMSEIFCNLLRKHYPLIVA